VTPCSPSLSILILAGVALAGFQKLGKLFVAVEHTGPDAKEANASGFAPRIRFITTISVKT
jgi:hypothetical protein